MFKNLPARSLENHKTVFVLQHSTVFFFLLIEDMIICHCPTQYLTLSGMTSPSFGLHYQWVIMAKEFQCLVCFTRWRHQDSQYVELCQELILSRLPKVVTTSIHTALSSKSVYEWFMIIPCGQYQSQSLCVLFFLNIS